MGALLFRKGQALESSWTKKSLNVFAFLTKGVFQMSRGTDLALEKTLWQKAKPRYDS